MDLVTLRAALEPFVTLLLYIVASGVGVASVTQLLKDHRFPVPAQTYPRTVSAIGAVLATFISLYVGDINFLLNNVWQYVGLGFVILLASAFSYNVLLKGLTTEKP